VTASARPAPSHVSVLEASPDALLVVAEAFNIAMVNAAAERMFGYSREELVGQHYRVLLAEGFRNGLQRLFINLRRNAETAGIELFEAYGLRRDGSEFPGEVACSLLAPDADTDSAAGVSMAVAVRDTSHRQKADAGLREATSLLTATLESTADGILVVNAEGQIANFNSHFVTMWDIPEELIATQHPQTVLRFVKAQLKDPEAFLERVDAVYAGVTPLVAQDIAECIAWVASRPAHVNIDLVQVTPQQQAGVHKVVRD